MALMQISPTNWVQICSRMTLTAISTATSPIRPSTLMTTTTQFSIGLMLTTITMEFGITSKLTATSTLMTTRARTTAISSKATTVTIMMMTVTMRTLTTMASIRPFGTKESCHKACEARVSMTLTTITTVFLTEKTKMTITTDEWMLTKKNSQVASGARNNPPGTMTTTVL